MRVLWVPVLLLALGACAAQPAGTATAGESSGASPCPDPRPQVCTMEYRPTCAVLAGGGNREYASPCNACADDSVTAVLSGPCPE